MVKKNKTTKKNNTEAIPVATNSNQDSTDIITEIPTKKNIQFEIEENLENIKEIHISDDEKIIKQAWKENEAKRQKEIRENFFQQQNLRRQQMQIKTQQARWSIKNVSS